MSKRSLHYRSTADMPPGMARRVPTESATPASRPYCPTSGAGAPGQVAKGRPRHVAGEMNRTESAYADELERRKRAGEIAWYVFESVKLRLAKATFLTIDFFVMLANGDLEAHEVKGGHWEDDARVKIKVAAQQYPFRFLAVQKDGAQWRVESFGA